MLYTAWAPKWSRSVGRHASSRSTLHRHSSALSPASRSPLSPRWGRQVWGGTRPLRVWLSSTPLSLPSPGSQPAHAPPPLPPFRCHIRPGCRSGHVLLAPPGGTRRDNQRLHAAPGEGRGWRDSREGGREVQDEEKGGLRAEHGSRFTRLKPPPCPLGHTPCQLWCDSGGEPSPPPSPPVPPPP